MRGASCHRSRPGSSPSCATGCWCTCSDSSKDAKERRTEMKVLVADKFEKSGIDGLAAAGCEVVYEPELKDDALVQAIGATGAEVLVVRSTKVTTPMLDAERLSLIVRAGAGYNTID